MPPAFAPSLARLRLGVASLLLLLLAACASAPLAPPPSSPPPSSPAPVASTPAPPPLSPAPAAPADAEVTRWSHDVVASLDRGDAAALGAVLSAGFLQHEGGAPRTREELLADVAKRPPGPPAVAERTWQHERVSVHEPYASFVGEAVEREGNNDVHGGGYRWTGWYTLVWAHEAAGWKLAYWGWRQGGGASERAVWNEIFHNDVGFEKEPNRLLVETVAKVRPGRALDVAMGQGRNALWLASRGWKVTGVDFSDDGVRAASAAAAARHVPLDAVNADLETYDFGVAKWDLVTMIYVPKKPGWIARAQRSLKPGGLFVLEYFHEVAPGDGGIATGELAALFKDGFDVLRDETVEATPDWAVSKATLVRFVARRR